LLFLLSHVLWEYINDSTLSYACLGPLATDFLLTANCAYILIIHNYSSDNNEHIYRAEFGRSNIIFFIKQEKEYCLTLRYIGEISYQLIIETLLGPKQA
jgi:hypothetical protein